MFSQFRGLFHKKKCFVIPGDGSLWRRNLSTFGELCTWVPNFLETMSHCPIDNSEMSQCAIAHSTYIAFQQSNFRADPFL